MAKSIPLTQGQHALVDDEDYERVIAIGPWHATRSHSGFYAHRRILVGRKQLNFTLAGFILNAPRGTPVDHINRNTLDNRRVNLRLANPALQNHNRKSITGSTSRYKGVSRSRYGKPWQARIRHNGRDVHIGMFTLEEDAARAYDAAAREIYGEDAFQNFPNTLDK